QTAINSLNHVRRTSVTWNRKASLTFADPGRVPDSCRLAIPPPGGRRVGKSPPHQERGGLFLLANPSVASIRASPIHQWVRPTIGQEAEMKSKIMLAIVVVARGAGPGF